MRLLAPIIILLGMSLLGSSHSRASDLMATFEKNCVQCHGENGKIKGKVNLLEVKSPTDLAAKPDLLEELIEVLEFEEMPPEDEPPLDVAIREKHVKELKALLADALSQQTTLPKTPIRRMNRFQYSNAVQDLFDLKVEVFTLPERMLRDYNYFDPASGKMPNQLKAGSRPLGKSQLIQPRLAGVAPFPQDLRAEHGFDNRGDHLSLSPLLMESFLKLSRSVVDSPDFTEKRVGIWKEFFAEPPAKADSDAVIRKRLQTFLTRAFRRHVDDTVVDRYAGYVIAEIQSGTSFTDGMKAVAAAAISSPRFLYLYDDTNNPHFELASKLSFFLWGSIPDAELIELAQNGTLSNPEVLTQQVDRMLNERKLKRFCDSFPSQWLQLEHIISAAPDPKLHPNFYFAKYRASMHMMLEPLLLFETILIEDRPILELIDANFSYRSDLLKAWYRDGSKSKKIPPTAIPFTRVALNNRREGGVITNAATMTMTSNATRTQPITRGAWMATVIFNDPPEPPPADVPELPEEPSHQDENLTMRERLAAHRERADCAGCHEQIDPLGFALENYGPTGLWRDVYENGRKVDSEGKLFRQHEFQSIVEFKDAILTEKERFARGFAEHLLSFALAREIEPADSLSLDKIVNSSAASEFRFRQLIKQIVLSDSFRYTSESSLANR